MHRFIPHVLAYVCIIMLVISCHSHNQQSGQTSQQDSLQALENQILHVHDSLMGKIGDLRRASATMQHLRDSLHLQNAAWDRIINQLSLADSAMFNWMGQFDIDKDTAQPDLRKQYLITQLQYVEQVKDSMYRALDSAQILLKPYTER
ncbi:MAG: hypothetical protein IRZ01_05660 [Thermoflavifilum aggregans]|nr:hypothetical protein [Thermoflavifilum aggregans]